MPLPISTAFYYVFLCPLPSMCPCALLISTAFYYVLCPSMMSLCTFDRVILKSFPEEVDEEARDECYHSGQGSER